MAQDLSNTTRARVVISGRVQGVFFRATTRNRAQEKGVRGWVRNRPDGKVEAVFEGTRDRVQSMVSWCHGGPRMAQVESVEVEWEEPTGDFRDFSVRH